MTRFEPNTLIKEGADLGLILQSGEITFDIVWVGGSTSRYRYDASREVHVASPFDLDGQDLVVVHLQEEARAARKERLAGMRVKRGQVHPSR